MLNLILIFFLVCFFISFMFLLILFKEFVYFFSYLFLTWFLLFFFIAKDSLDFLNFWIAGLGENLIIQDTSDILWAMFFISSFYSFCFIFPYFLFLLYFIFFNSLYTKEKKIIFFLFIFLIYLEILIIYILFNDLYFSNFFDISNLNLNFFELQIELDHFLHLIRILFFDLIKSLICYQIFLLLWYKEKYFYFLKNKNIYLFIFSFFLFAYWFGGESLNFDLILIFMVFIFCEIIYFFQLIALNLRQYKEKSSLVLF